MNFMSIGVNKSVSVYHIYINIYIKKSNEIQMKYIYHIYINIYIKKSNEIRMLVHIKEIMCIRDQTESTESQANLSISM